MITLAEIAPTVLTAISEPDSRPACRASSASSAEAAGKLRPITTVTGRTTRIAEPARARSVASDWLGVKNSGRTTTPTSPSRTSAATRICAAASSRTGSVIRGRMKLNNNAPIARPTRKIARMIVNTYVVFPVPEASSRVHST